MKNCFNNSTHLDKTKISPVKIFDLIYFNYFYHVHKLKKYLLKKSILINNKLPYETVFLRLTQHYINTTISNRDQIIRMMGCE